MENGSPLDVAPIVCAHKELMEGFGTRCIQRVICSQIIQYNLKTQY